MAKLAKALNTNTLGDLKALAEILQRQGRGRDTILAHITPKEARYLKERGGRGSKNPMTGLLEYDGAEVPAPVTDVAPPTIAPVDTSTMISPETQAAVNTPIDVSSYASAPAAQDTSGTYSLAGGGGQYGGMGPSNIGAPLSAGTGLAGPGPTPSLLPTDVQNAVSAASDIQGEQQIPEVQKQSVYDRIAKMAGGPDALKRLGLAGALGLFGASTSRKAAGQAQAAQAEQQALATPYQTAGRQMIGAAEKGQLTPASMQAYQAAQAQLAQKGAITGGVGAQQAAVQLEEFRQKLLEQQYNYGLQVAGIGDQIALGAIRTGLQLDQAMAQSTQNFYTSLAAIASGIPFKTGG